VPAAKHIVKLADENNLDGLLALVSIEEMADAWWRYTARWDIADSQGTPLPEWDNDPDSWAEQVWQSEVLEQREDVVRAFLHAAAERVPDPNLLGYLGAGPVEDFAANDEDRLCWIEEEATRSPNFRAALANFQAKMKLSDESNARIERAAEAD
jgi:hypothetical protein